MSETLHRLIYRSANAITGTAERVESEIAAILETSRARNAAAGVTGVLIHTGEAFTQLIEGHLPAIEEVFDRITMDLRHTAFELLQFAPIRERGFSDWQMAYVGPDALSALVPGDEKALAQGPTEGVLRAIAEALRGHPGGQAASSR